MSVRYEIVGGVMARREHTGSEGVRGSFAFV
jgi:hypothetical protein